MTTRAELERELKANQATRGGVYGLLNKYNQRAGKLRLPEHDQQRASGAGCIRRLLILAVIYAVIVALILVGIQKLFDLSIEGSLPTTNDDLYTPAKLREMKGQWTTGLEIALIPAALVLGLYFYWWGSKPTQDEIEEARSLALAVLNAEAQGHRPGEVLTVTPAQQAQSPTADPYRADALKFLNDTGYIEGYPLAEATADHPVKLYGLALQDLRHVLSVAPTGAGKGLHMTTVLLCWHGACVVNDPKSEAWERTAMLREAAFGRVYHMPGDSINLNQYFNLTDPSDAEQLMQMLVRPPTTGEGKQWAEGCLSLFMAIGHYAKATGKNAVRCLLDASQSSPGTVAAELLRVNAPYATKFFMDLPPDKLSGNRTFLSYWSAFERPLTLIAPYKESIAAERPTIPADWQERGATIYLCYDFTTAGGAAPAVSATIAALIRRAIQRRNKAPTLFLIDEAATSIVIPKMPEYLATVRGYDCYITLYIQNIAQLRQCYGSDLAETILGNCHHKLISPPRTYGDADLISKSLGERIELRPSYSLSDNPHGVLPNASESVSRDYRPMMTPGELMGLPEEAVLVLTLQGGAMRKFIANRCNPIWLFPHLPGPDRLMRIIPAPPPFRYEPWTVSETQPAKITAQPPAPALTTAPTAPAITGAPAITATPATCPNCGKPANPQGRFCAFCGQPIIAAPSTAPAMQPAAWTCPTCNGENEQTARTCIFCSTSKP